MKDLIETDVLIIGSGISGGVAALQLADRGTQVTVITRAEKPHTTNTFQAQGGIVYKGKNDSTKLLSKDVINAGAGFCNTNAVEILAAEGPGLVENILIKRLGIQFDKKNNGELSLVREGAHSKSRILHVADATGKTIEKAIIKALLDNSNINLIPNSTAIDLLTPSHHSKNRHAIYDPQSCVGAYYLDRKQNIVKRCIAKNTVIASGGLGQIYLRTTNPTGARGDGIAMAYRAGARVINNEFVQFHPTAFYYQDSVRFLISEATRGAGARLVNECGEPFMQNYAPKMKDLAPRDIVSRSIHQEMLLTNKSNVYLDMFSYISVKKIKSNFPNVYKNCKSFGIDITKQLIPVVPAAHYACGGVWTDEFGGTSIKNCYAVGEVACTGVHGANRLASISLLEGLIWGDRAAKHIQNNLNNIPKPKSSDIPSWHEEGIEIPDPALISQDMSVIKNIMWNYVGLIRSKRRLARALTELRNLETEIEKFYRATKVNDELIGLRNAVRTSIIIANAAWENKTSIGCHYRED